MPASLRFVLLLSAMAAFTAPISGYVIHQQTETQARISAEEMTGGKAEDGKATFARYGCGSCHQIEGIPDAKGKVGPSLKGFAGRAEIAGLLANQPDQLVRWLRHPQEVSPGNGMPDQGVSDRDSRNMAAYLYTLR